MGSRFKTLSLLVVLVLSSSACTTEATTTNSEPAIDSGTEAPESETEADRPCEGGAFPDDDEFRELLCALQWAQLDLVRDGGEINPDWSTRISDAMLGYADDRTGAVDDLNALLDEMTNTP